MTEILLVVVAVLSLVTLIVAGLVLAAQKGRGGETEASARALREELAAGADRTSQALIT